MNTRKLFYVVDGALIIAIAVSAILLFAQFGQAPPPTKAPNGTLGKVSIVSSNKVSIELNNFSQTVQFSEVSIRITAPNGELCTASFTNQSLDYPQNPPLHSLSMIRISSYGVLGVGQSITLENYKALQIGIWSVTLIHKPTGGIMAQKGIVIPDTETTPYGPGALSTIEKISSSVVRVRFGSISPAIEFSFCKLTITTGSGDRYSWEMDQSSTTSYTLDPSLTATVVDDSNDGIITPNDYIELKTSNLALPSGAWSVELTYLFTDGRIAYNAFTIT